jgi:ABC-type branched-subunit amino acid transport system permease subunit
VTRTYLPCLLPLLAVLLLGAVHPSPYAFKVATFIGISTLYGMSLNMIWGFGGQFSMGQMALAAIGAYVGTLCVTAGPGPAGAAAARLPFLHRHAGGGADHAAGAV